MVSFLPQAIHLFGPPMLVGTLGKCEREAAASLLIYTLQERGNSWRPVAWAEVAEVMRSAPEPWQKLLSNPFFSVDFDGLVAVGYATKHEDGKIELLPTALERLTRYIMPSLRAVLDLDVSPEALFAPRLGDRELLRGEV